MSVPTHPDAFTTAWLERALGAPPKSLRRFSASPIGTGQMSLSFRIALHWKGHDGPASIVAKCPSPDAGTRAIAHADEIKKDLAGSGYTLPQAALKWVLAHPAVSVVIPGIRNVAQADANCGVSDLPAMPAALVEKLRRHNWLRGVWYSGK